MGFVAASLDEYPHTAALLLQMTQDAGLDVSEVRTVPGGFEVPDAVSSQLEDASAPAVPAVKTVGPDKTPPPSWDEPLPKVDVEQGKDGKFYADVKAEPAVTKDEEIRIWARENGHKVADKGRLPKRVIDAYHAANDG